MSYANMEGVPTQTAGTSEILAADWNTFVRDNFDSIKFGHIVCTSSTRPTGIAEGTMIYETDTNFIRVYDGSNWIFVSNVTGGTTSTTIPYYYVDTVYYTSAGNTFSKASYPWLRAINIKVQAGGGAGGGGATSNRGAGGGGAGGYAERFFTDISSLDASVTATVGAGGGTSTGDGSAGGDSTFGSSGNAWFTKATGGSGGGTAGAGGDEGVGTDGDLLLRGAAGSYGSGTTALGSLYISGAGGSSHLGGNGRGLILGTATNGDPGGQYGGGGGGAVRVTNDRVGGDGASGIIIVELFA